MLDRCRCHLVTHGMGEALKALSAAMTDPGDRRRGQPHAEQVSHQHGEALLGQGAVSTIRGFDLDPCSPVIRPWPTAGIAGHYHGMTERSDLLDRFRRLADGHNW